MEDVNIDPQTAAMAVLRSGLLVWGTYLSHLAMTDPTKGSNKGAVKKTDMAFTWTKSLLVFEKYMLWMNALVETYSAAVCVFGPPLAVSLRSTCPADSFVQWTPRFSIGLALLIVGASLRLYSYKALGKHFTFQLMIQKDHKLIKSGLYAYVRHPAYSGGMLLLYGIWFVLLRQGGMLDCHIPKVCFDVLQSWPVTAAFAVQPLLINIPRARTEDKLLEERFGEEWRQYTRDVAGFIPFVW